MDVTPKQALDSSSQLVWARQPLDTEVRTEKSLIELDHIVDVVTTTLAVLDSERPVGSGGRFKPGIGPLRESEVTGLLCRRLAMDQGVEFANAAPRGYPNSRAECDLVLPGHWAIEIKLARPFGDNGKPAERWSENLLYPYPGNTSSVGDALKLLESTFRERKAVLVFGYEHTPPRIPLEPAIQGFELLATSIVGIELGPRRMQTATSLIHPYHQQVTVYGWEVLGRKGRAA